MLPSVKFFAPKRNEKSQVEASIVLPRHIMYSAVIEPHTIVNMFITEAPMKDMTKKYQL
jgi:hypothetical protein